MAITGDDGFEIARGPAAAERRSGGSEDLLQILGGQIDCPTSSLEYEQHREEAAFGAGLVCGVAAGLLPDLDAAGRLIAHQTTIAPN